MSWNMASTEHDLEAVQVLVAMRTEALTDRQSGRPQTDRQPAVTVSPPPGLVRKQSGGRYPGLEEIQGTPVYVRVNSTDTHCLKKRSRSKKQEGSRTQIDNPAPADSQHHSQIQNRMQNQNQEVDSALEKDQGARRYKSRRQGELQADAGPDKPLPHSQPQQQTDTIVQTQALSARGVFVREMYKSGPESSPPPALALREPLQQRHVGGPRRTKLVSEHINARPKMLRPRRPFVHVEPRNLRTRVIERKQNFQYHCLHRELNSDEIRLHAKASTHPQLPPYKLGHVTPIAPAASPVSVLAAVHLAGQQGWQVDDPPAAYPGSAWRYALLPNLAPALNDILPTLDSCRRPLPEILGRVAKKPKLTGMKMTRGDGAEVKKRRATPVLLLSGWLAEAVAAHAAELSLPSAFLAGKDLKFDWDGWVRSQLKLELWRDDGIWTRIISICAMARMEMKYRFDQTVRNFRADFIRLLIHNIMARYHQASSISDLHGDHRHHARSIANDLATGRRNLESKVSLVLILDLALAMSAFKEYHQRSVSAALARCHSLGIIVAEPLKICRIMHEPDVTLSSIVDRIGSAFGMCEDNGYEAVRNLRSIIADVWNSLKGTMQYNPCVDPAPGIPDASSFWVRAVTSFCRGLPKVLVTRCRRRSVTKGSSTGPTLAFGAREIDVRKQVEDDSDDAIFNVNAVDVERWVRSLFDSKLVVHWSELANSYLEASSLLKAHLNDATTEHVVQSICELVLRTALVLSCDSSLKADADQSLFSKARLDLNEDVVASIIREQSALNDRTLTFRRLFDFHVCMVVLKRQIFALHSSSQSGLISMAADSSTAPMNEEISFVDSLHTSLNALLDADTCFSTLTCHLSDIAKVMVGGSFDACLDWTLLIASSPLAHATVDPVSPRCFEIQVRAISAAFRNALSYAMRNQCSLFKLPIAYPVTTAAVVTGEALLHACRIVEWNPTASMYLVDEAVGISSRMRRSFDNGHGYPLCWHREMVVFDVLDAMYNMGQEERASLILSRIAEVLRLEADFNVDNCDERVTSILEERSKVGNAAALHLRGRLLAYDGWERLRERVKCARDQSKGMDLLVRAAKAGNSNSFCAIQELLQYGVNRCVAPKLPPSIVRMGVSCLLQFCKSSAEAALSLGHIYFRGASGVPVNYTSASEYYRSVLDMKNSSERTRGDAAAALGDTYFGGLSCVQDGEEAAKYYIIAMGCSPTNNSRTRLADVLRCDRNRCFAVNMVSAREQYRAHFFEKSSRDPTRLTLKKMETGEWKSFEIYVDAKDEERFLSSLETLTANELHKFKQADLDSQMETYLNAFHALSLRSSGCHDEYTVDLPERQGEDTHIGGHSTNYQSPESPYRWRGLPVRRSGHCVMFQGLSSRSVGVKKKCIRQRRSHLLGLLREFGSRSTKPPPGRLLITVRRRVFEVGHDGSWLLGFFGSDLRNARDFFSGHEGNPASRRSVPKTYKVNLTEESSSALTGSWRCRLSDQAELFINGVSGMQICGEDKRTRAANKFSRYCDSVLVTWLSGELDLEWPEEWMTTTHISKWLNAADFVISCCPRFRAPNLPTLTAACREFIRGIFEKCALSLIKSATSGSESCPYLVHGDHPQAGNNRSNFATQNFEHGDTDNKPINEIRERFNLLSKYHTDESQHGPTLLKVLRVFIFLRLFLEDGLLDAEALLEKALHDLGPETTRRNSNLFSCAASVSNNCSNAIKLFQQSLVGACHPRRP